MIGTDLSPAAAADIQPAPARPALDEPQLLETIADVCRDSAQHPDRYLRDTVVPHGGE